MHIREQTECEKTDRFNGLHFICYICRKKAFVDCAYAYSDEVKSMLKVLKVVIPGKNGTASANVRVE